MHSLAPQCPTLLTSDDLLQKEADAYVNVTSSPYFPQSNGEAERAVGTIKSLLKKSRDPYLALLAYRTTPLQVGCSPSELLMYRMLRSTVPTSCSQRLPRIPDLDMVLAKDQRIKAKQKRDFDSHHGARALPPLEQGDPVWLPDRQTEGEIREEVAPQSYQVESPDGLYRHNRRDIIRLPDSSEETLSPDEGEPSDLSNATEPSQPAEQRRSARVTCPPDRFDPSWAVP